MTTQATQVTDTRELIVESAFACFGRQGLQKATIVDIAKRWIESDFTEPVEKVVEIALPFTKIK